MKVHKGTGRLKLAHKDQLEAQRAIDTLRRLGVGPGVILDDLQSIVNRSVRVD